MYTHTHIHTYIHEDIHTYVLTYILTYTLTNVKNRTKTALHLAGFVDVGYMYDRDRMHVLHKLIYMYD